MLTYLKSEFTELRLVKILCKSDHLPRWYKIKQM